MSLPGVERHEVDPFIDDNWVSTVFFHPLHKQVAYAVHSRNELLAGSRIETFVPYSSSVVVLFGIPDDLHTLVLSHFIRRCLQTERLATIYRFDGFNVAD